jgi:putative transposase
MGKGFHYSIQGDKSYFLTMTVVDWINLFTRVNHKMLVIDSLKYCQEKKGLNIFGWCLMTNHLHMIANTRRPYDLDDVIRDFKRFTCNKLIDQIASEPESRREWLLDKFNFAARSHSKTKNFKIWQDGSHPVELFTERFTWQKLNYIHRNPVVDKIVEKEEDYLFSSARNYYKLSSLLPVHLLTPPVITVSSRDFYKI